MKKLLLVILCIFLTLSCYAQNGKVSEYQFKNGLRLIVKENHRAPVVIAQIWYKVGASYEQNGTTGISHALEHMMFRGTKRYGPGVLKKMIASNGGIINAGTDYDFTVYYATVAAKKLPIVLKLEADRMHGLLLDPAAFKKEMQVVMEERRMRTDDNPQSLAYERFMATAHVTNPYHHPIIGWENDIKQLTVKNLRDWYHAWYVPNNAIIVIVGDVEPKSARKLVKKYFAAIPTKPTPRIKTKKELEPLGERSIDINVHAKLPFLIMGYNVPSLKTIKNKQEAYALTVAAAVLNGGQSSRFTKELIRKQQIAVSASAYYSLFQRLDHLFVLTGIQTPHHNIQDLQNAFIKEIHKLQTTLVSDQELERIKTQVIAEKVYSKDSIEHQALEIGSLEAVGIPWEEGEKFPEKINAVTPEQIRAVAKKYLTHDRLTIAILNPLS